MIRSKRIVSKHWNLIERCNTSVGIEALAALYYLCARHTGGRAHPGWHCCGGRPSCTHAFAGLNNWYVAIQRAVGWGLEPLGDGGCRITGGGIAWPPTGHGSPPTAAHGHHAQDAWGTCQGGHEIVVCWAMGFVIWRGASPKHKVGSRWVTVWHPTGYVAAAHALWFANAKPTVNCAEMAALVWGMELLAGR